MKTAIELMAPSVPNSIWDNRDTKEKGKAKERGAAEVAVATGEAEVVEEKEKEATVRKTVGPG